MPLRRKLKTLKHKTLKTHINTDRCVDKKNPTNCRAVSTSIYSNLGYLEPGRKLAMRELSAKNLRSSNRFPLGNCRWRHPAACLLRYLDCLANSTATLNKKLCKGFSTMMPLIHWRVSTELASSLWGKTLPRVDSADVALTDGVKVRCWMSCWKLGVVENLGEELIISSILYIFLLTTRKDKEAVTDLTPYRLLPAKVASGEYSKSVPFLGWNLSMLTC